MQSITLLKVTITNKTEVWNSHPKVNNASLNPLNNENVRGSKATLKQAKPLTDE